VLKESRGLKDGFINYPPMIFAVSEDELYVYGYDGKDPRKLTTVNRLPFLNVYQEEGNVCLGDIALDKVHKAETFREYLDAWESVFFDTKFSTGAGGSHEFMKKITNKARVNWKLFRTKKVKFKSLMR
jgi:hypothetical protein